MGGEFIILFVPIAPLVVLSCAIGLILTTTRRKLWWLLLPYGLVAVAVCGAAIIQDNAIHTLATWGVLLFLAALPLSGIIALTLTADRRALQSAWKPKEQKRPSGQRTSPEDA